MSGAGTCPPDRCLAYFTGRGLVRAQNEDAIAIDGGPVVQEVVQWCRLTSGSDHLVLVADGMGGHVRGELASRLAVRAFSADWLRLRQQFDPLNATRTANRVVYDAMQHDEKLLGMGATVVGMHLSQDKLVWFNVGDSRLYLFRTGRLQQLSTDHVPRGSTAGGRKNHSITQSIGGAHRLIEVWPAIGTLELCTEDLLLCCSDGLTDCVTDPQIAAACAGDTSVAGIVQQLINDAEAGGTPDNISVVVVRF